MAQTASLAQWETDVATHMPHLRRSVVRLLAWYSFGMVVAQSCGCTTVSVFLAQLLGMKENTVRQRLREWSYESAAKRGRFRQQLDVRPCFPALIRWILAAWPSDERRLVLVLDATTLRQTVTVLTISVVYRGCAIPVAWACVGAITPGAWRPHWEELLTTIAPSIPADWMVLVMADRGLYARWLFDRITANGWHPFLRINAHGLVRVGDHAAWTPLADQVPRPGDAWAGTVTCFKGTPLRCTLVGMWSAEHADPWLIVTDLPPDQAEVAWYGMRTWIEQGFKDIKRGGWHWEQTKMTDPARIARLWLVIAVATLWVVRVGGEADATLPASSLDALPPTHIARRRQTNPATRPRTLGCFRRGVLRILVALLRQEPLPRGRFIPDPWPEPRDTYP